MLELKAHVSSHLVINRGASRRVAQTFSGRSPLESREMLSITHLPVLLLLEFSFGAGSIGLRVVAASFPCDHNPYGLVPHRT